MFEMYQMPVFIATIISFREAPEFPGKQEITRVTSITGGAAKSNFLTRQVKYIFNGVRILPRPVL